LKGSCFADQRTLLICLSYKRTMEKLFEKEDYISEMSSNEQGKTSRELKPGKPAFRMI
jgi:hypothetical protein